MLQYAYSGTAEERSKLLNAVKQAAPVAPGDDAETQLEKWRRLVSYLPRFGIATPDYGEMVTAAELLVKRFEKDDQFALDRALYVREHRVHNIGAEDADVFKAYLDYLVSLVRVAGGSVATVAGKYGAPPTVTSGSTVCDFFASGKGCRWGKQCRSKHETDRR